MNAYPIPEDVFMDVWQPIDNPADGSMYWEYADLGGTPLHQIWSLIDGDEDDGMYAIPGYHGVNVFAYAVTTREWTAEEDADGLQAVWITPGEVVD